MHYALFQNIKIKHSKAPSFAGANVSLILGHFQKCLTETFPYFSIFSSKIHLYFVTNADIRSIIQVYKWIYSTRIGSQFWLFMISRKKGGDIFGSN